MRRQESLVSDVVDTGVYVFSAPALFDVLSTIVEGKPPPNMERADSFNGFALNTRRADSLWAHQTVCVAVSPGSPVPRAACQCVCHVPEPCAADALRARLKLR